MLVGLKSWQPLPPADLGSAEEHGSPDSQRMDPWRTAAPHHREIELLFTLQKALAFTDGPKATFPDERQRGQPGQPRGPPGELPSAASSSLNHKNRKI